MLGNCFCVILAVARYFAKLGGLYPTDDHVKAARVDMFVDTWEDTNSAVSKLGAQMFPPGKRENDENMALIKSICEEGGKVDEALAKVSCRVDDQRPISITCLPSVRGLCT